MEVTVSWSPPPRKQKTYEKIVLPGDLSIFYSEIPTSLYKISEIKTNLGFLFLLLPFDCIHFFFFYGVIIIWWTLKHGVIAVLFLKFKIITGYKFITALVKYLQTGLILSPVKILCDKLEDSSVSLTIDTY